MSESGFGAGGFFSRLLGNLVGRIVVAGICVAVVVSGLALPPVRSWLVSAVGDRKDGLTTERGPRVKVSKKSPGRPVPLTHEPNWTPRAVKLPPVGTATVTPGRAFAAAGSLPVKVADAAAGEAVVAPARRADREQRALARVWTPQRLAADRAAAEAERKATRPAPVVPSKPPVRVTSGPDKGVYGTVPVAPDPTDVEYAKALAAEEVADASVATASAGGGPVTVTTLDRAKTAALAGRVLGFTVRRESGGNAPVSVSVDYSGFADAYGGGFGGRLRLVSLPPCALTTPQVPACQVATPVVGVE